MSTLETLKAALSRWWARRVLTWHNVCPKHLLDRGMRIEDKEVKWGCKICSDDADKESSRRFWAKRKKVNASIAAAKSKLEAQ